MGRSDAYFQDFANACDNLAVEATNTWRAPGNSLSLPPILRKLNAEFVEISTNRVFIGVGIGRAGYGIIWEQDDSDPALWELRTNAEGLQKVLVTRRKLTLPRL